MADTPFNLLVAAAFVDGTISDTELQVLKRKASQWQITGPQLSALMDQARQGSLRLVYPSSQKDREKRLDDLLDVICADGRVEAPERQMILRYATLLGGVPADLNDRIRARLSNASKKNPHETVRTDSRVDEARKADAPRQADPARQADPPRLPNPPPPPSWQQMSKPPEMTATGSPTSDFVRGPIELGGAQLGPPMTELPPITLALVIQVIQYDGRDEAVEYLSRACLMNATESAKLIDKVLATHPEVKPGGRRMRHHLRPT